MPVDIVDETEREAALAQAAMRAADAILTCVARGRGAMKDAELCVMLVGDERMRELNRDWRGKDSTTDVLSFSQIEGEAAPAAGTMLGDVVVSVERLRSQAADGGWTDEQELARLLLHGVLHLLGYDHEDVEDAQVMRAEEGRIVQLLAAQAIACAWEEEASL